MNISNAYMFVVVGVLMEALHLAPAVNGARELWLMVMGVVMVAVGGAFLTRVAWAWVKPRMVTPLAAWAARSVEADANGRAVPQGRRVTG